MTKATFYNMKLLCYIDDVDFTDYQGIGSDPMYKRFESVQSVIKNNIEQKFQSFLARPYYEDGIIYWYVDEWNETPKCYNELTEAEKKKYTEIKEETVNHYNSVLSKLKAEEYVILSGALKFINNDFLYCYDDKVILIAWGMRPDTAKHVISGSWVKGLNNKEKNKITFDAGVNGKLQSPIHRVINREKGYKLKSNDIPTILENANYVFDCWSPDPLNYEVISDCTFTALYQKKKEEVVAPLVSNDVELENVSVQFDSSNCGYIEGSDRLIVSKGTHLNSNSIPIVRPNQGYKFLKWTPSIYDPIMADTLFVAEYQQNIVSCYFNVDDHGILQGEGSRVKSFGDSLAENEIPIVKAKKGYKFIGWDKPIYGKLDKDTIFTACYEKNIPWYKRWWLMLTGKGCLKWLLWALLLLLLLWILSLLTRDCIGSRHEGTVPLYDTIQLESSNDNNGIIESIVDENGNLPKHSIVSPIVGNDGVQPPVIHNEGAPDVIGNRLNIYFDNKDADLNKWAHDFKNTYPSEEYKIIGYDKNVRMIQIQIPEEQRNIVRNEINNKIPNHHFFVVDESIITLNNNSEQSSSESNKGWHLKAVNLKQAWNITKGSPNIVVAIVDDGFDVNHNMLKGRFVKAYNVFTQNSSLSLGEGHGTHVAGLAVGSTNYYNEGASGVAPLCKIMPIQVFDNGICTFSSIASGIMYAIHNGANVVNISIGPSFKGLNKMPLSEQKKVAEIYFKNEELVYRHIIEVANEKNVLLVFAAGNDNIMTAILPECRNTNGTINVAAVTPNYKAAKFTNYSVGTNISAPGVDIYSSFPKNSFKSFEGTSMAAPIVTGTIALIKSLNPQLTAGQIICLMQQTGRKVDNLIPPMIQIDQILLAVKQGRIPNCSKIKDGKDDQTQIVDQRPPNDGQTDNYKSLKSMLEKLKTERAKLDEKINNIENKIK